MSKQGSKLKKKENSTEVASNIEKTPVREKTTPSASTDYNQRKEYAQHKSLRCTDNKSRESTFAKSEESNFRAGQTLTASSHHDKTTVNDANKNPNLRSDSVTPFDSRESTPVLDAKGISTQFKDESLLFKTLGTDTKKTQASTVKSLTTPPVTTSESRDIKSLTESGQLNPSAKHNLLLKEHVPTRAFLCASCSEDIETAYTCNRCEKSFCANCKFTHYYETKHTLRELVKDVKLIHRDPPDRVGSTEISLQSPPYEHSVLPAGDTKLNTEVVVASGTKQPLPYTRNRMNTDKSQQRETSKLQRESSDVGISRGKYRKCFVHPNRDIQLHCVQCSKIVCSECIIECHQRHQFVSIDEAATSLRSELNALLVPIKHWYDTDACKTLSNLQTAEDTYKSRTSETVDAIGKRAGQLHKDIDRIKDNLIEDVDEKREIELREFLVVQQELSEKMKTAENVIERVEKSTKDEDIRLLRSEKDLKLTMSTFDMKLSLKEATPPHFISGVSADEYIITLFGQTYIEKPQTTVSWSLQSNTLKSTRDLDLIPVNSISCGDGQPIHAMVPLGETEIWVSGQSNPKQIQPININGSMEKPRVFDFVVNDLAISRNGDLFLSCFDTRSVKRLRVNGKLETFFGASPLYPRGIHISRSGTLLACIVDSTSTDTRQIRPYSKRQLVKINKNGKIMKRIAFISEIRVFTSPIKVAETTEEEVCVIDKTAKDQGRVVVLTRSDQIKFVYTGQTSVRLDFPFCPTDLTCDVYGHVIITDANNNAIHMVDKRGQVLRVHYIKRDWVDVPHAVVVDNKGLMAVGDSTGVVHVVRYLS